MRRGTAAALAAPAGLLFLLFFAVPFATMAAMSVLTDNPLISERAAFTWRHYERLAEDSYYFEIIWATLRLGLWTTGVSLLLGYPLALLIARVRSAPGAHAAAHGRHRTDGDGAGGAHLRLAACFPTAG